MADKMMRIAGRNDQNRAKPIQTDRTGNLITAPRPYNTILEIKESSTSFNIETEKGNTVTILMNNPDNEDPYGFYMQGAVDRESRFNVPVIDYNRILRTDPIIKDGIYHVDVSGLNELSIKQISSKSTSKITAIVSTSPCPQPVDAPVKYQRITSEDGLIKGDFRAIEPLTDISLHEQTQLLGEYNNSVNGGRPFERGDERKQGHTLFGPFSQVRLDNGKALLVLL